MNVDETIICLGNMANLALRLVDNTDFLEATATAIRALKKYDEIVRIINAPIYIQEDVFRYKAICAVVVNEADSVRPDYMPLIEKEGEKSNE